jgi:predicted DNA-binding transcriptional regulator AlpA
MKNTPNQLDHELDTSEASALPDSLLTAREVGAILGVRPKRVYELGIPSIRLSERSVRWRPQAVAQWIREREVEA